MTNTNTTTNTVNITSKHVVEITEYPTYKLISTHTVRCGNTIVSYHATSREAVAAAADLRNFPGTPLNYTAHVTNDIVKDIIESTTAQVASTASEADRNAQQDHQLNQQKHIDELKAVNAELRRQLQEANDTIGRNIW